MPVHAGDYIALPSGPDLAHQFVNTGTSPLRYLCTSTMVAPEVTGYPESGKVGIVVGSAPGGPKEGRTFEGVFRTDDAVDYWAGEDVDGVVEPA